MLVEINLLQKKEQQRSFLLITAMALLLVVCLIFAAFYFIGSHYSSKIESAQTRINDARETASAIEAQLNEFESSNSAQILQESVEWAKEYPVKSVPLLRKLTQLLPERGFIQAFTYEQSGIVQLAVQFDSSREAAYYLNSLHGSAWIQDAAISSVTTGDQDTLPDDEGTDYLPRYLAEFEIIINNDTEEDPDVENSLDEGSGGV
ncbi:hypothetical protein B9K06_00920 [Bacillus sp. OG2]|nr:hypothetical protein B9K06_00920 [Bacillus sp. OG2]